MLDEAQNQKPAKAEYVVLLVFALMLGSCGQAFAQLPIVALQPGSHDQTKLDPPRGSRLISVAQLKTPGVVGVTVRGRRFDASKPEPKPWPLTAFYDQCQATAKQAGDWWTLLLCGGDDRNFTSEASIVARESLIADLGRRYAADPLLWGVHLTGASPYGVSEERHHKITPAIEAADRRYIAAWAKAFPRQRLLFAIGNKDDAGMQRLILYAKSIAPGRVVVKHNAMKADTKLAANHNRLIVWAGQQGLDIGFEMAAADSNWAKVRANIAAIEKQAGRKIVYLAVYPPDLAKAGGVK